MVPWNRLISSCGKITVLDFLFKIADKYKQVGKEVSSPHYGHHRFD